MADRKKDFADHLNIVWKFYKEHCEQDKNEDEFWNQLNEEYKKIISHSEPPYKDFMRRAILGAMEVLDEERKQDG